MKAELVVKGATGDEPFPFRGTRMTIGRGVHAHVRIADGMASREHCVVERVGDEYVLRDLGSANGTLVNGAHVGERALELGDRIQVGDTVVVFVLERDDPRKDETNTGLDIRAEKPESETRSFVLRSTEVSIRAAGHESFAADYLDLFYALTTTLSLKDSVTEVCDHLLKALVQGRRFGRAAVVLFDPSTGVTGERFTRAGQPGAAQKIMLDGVDLEDVRQTEKSVFRRGLKLADRVFSCMIVPLKGRDAVYGALYFDDFHAIGELQESELHLASAVGHQVGLLIENIHYARRLQKEKDTLQDMVAADLDIIGESRPMQGVLALIRKIAATDASVLIRGESGTGKELVARGLHLNSGRRAGPLITVNCAAIPVSLIESELFGHEKGAFTGATARRKGRFELASGGTLFLDEIGDLALESQGKLLRVLEDGRLRRVGGTDEIAVDVRVVAATHRDLTELVAAKKFREDLYYRLHVLEIALPALRERGDDIVVLADHFMQFFARKIGKRVNGLDVEARDLLRRHVWPGNVRELRNALERAVLLSGGSILGAGDFPALLSSAPLGSVIATLQEVERDHIARVLASVDGNKSEAARLLGVNRSTLYEKLERYKIGS